SSPATNRSHTPPSPPPRKRPQSLPSESSTLPSRASTQTDGQERAKVYEPLSVIRKAPSAVYHFVYIVVTPDAVYRVFRLRPESCHVYSYANTSVVATVGAVLSTGSGKALA